MKQKRVSKGRSFQQFKFPSDFPHKLYVALTDTNGYTYMVDREGNWNFFEQYYIIR